MEMTNSEILREFQGAKNKREQIRILADLNLCKPAAIVSILRDAGVDGRMIPMEYRGQTSPPSPSSTTPARNTTIKPRALHDWDRIAELAEAVRDAVAAGETPESAWIHEMSDTLIRYYPSSTKEGETKK
jgi:hypothetical protein